MFDELKKNFDKQGFVVVKNFLSVKEVKKARVSLSDFCNKYLKKKQRRKRDINFSRHNQVNSIHDMEKWRWVKKIRKLRKTKKILKLLLDAKPKNFGSELFAKPARVGLKSPVHQDNFYWCIKENKGLTFWLALNKSTKKNGCVYYYAGSHKVGLLKHRPSNAPGSSQTISELIKLKKFKKIYPELKVGDCLIHDVMIAHGSKPNNSNIPRRGLTFRFIPKNSTFDLSKKKKYEKDLKSQMKKRN